MVVVVVDNSVPSSGVWLMSQSDGSTVFDLQVSRRGGEVVVVVGGWLDQWSLHQLAHVVADLVEDQGNLFVAVEHADGDDEVLHETLGELGHHVGRGGLFDGPQPDIPRAR